MVKDQELVGFQRELGVSLSVVVREFDLDGAIQQFHDSADLPAQEAMRLAHVLPLAWTYSGRGTPVTVA